MKPAFSCLKSRLQAQTRVADFVLFEVCGFLQDTPQSFQRQGVLCYNTLDSAVVAQGLLSGPAVFA